MSLVLIVVVAWAVATLAALAVLGVVIVVQDRGRWRTAAVHGLARHWTVRATTGLPTVQKSVVPQAAAGGGAELRLGDVPKAPVVPYGAPVVRVAVLTYLTSAFVVMVLFSAMVSGANGRSWRRRRPGGPVTSAVRAGSRRRAGRTVEGPSAEA